jgi:hypothetical protein
VVRGRVLAWLTAGFMGCTAIGGVLADCAVAQVRDSLAVGPFSTTVRPQGAPRRSSAPSTVAEPAPMPEPSAADPDRPDPTVDEEPLARLPAGARRVPVDGDPNWPPQPQQPVDGVIEIETPQQPTDGGDPNIDTRPREEYEPFEMPTTGELPPGDPQSELNPEAFQVELSPILSRRPSQLARFEPFQPVGIRRGSFILFPEALRHSTTSSARTAIRVVTCCLM